MPKLHQSIPNSQLTAERARELLRYESAAGELYWRPVRGRVSTKKQAGCIVKEAYRRVRVDGIDYMAHRVAWLITFGVWPSFDLDHINGDRSDNRIDNLRDISRRHNSENQRCGRRGGLLGASFHKATSRWHSSIVSKGRTYSLGYWDTERDAHIAYKGAKRLIHAGCTI